MEHSANPDQTVSKGRVYLGSAGIEFKINGWLFSRFPKTYLVWILVRIEPETVLLSIHKLFHAKKQKNKKKKKKKTKKKQ